jgi:hypothetical protein
LRLGTAETATGCVFDRPLEWTPGMGQDTHCFAR